MQAYTFQVHDIICTPGHVSERVYLVIGIHLGSTDQEGVLELVAYDRKLPDAHGAAQKMFVPIEMIEAGLSKGVFSLTHP